MKTDMEPRVNLRPQVGSLLGKSILRGGAAIGLYGASAVTLITAVALGAIALTVSIALTPIAGMGFCAVTLGTALLGASYFAAAHHLSSSANKTRSAFLTPTASSS